MNIAQKTIPVAHADAPVQLFTLENDHGIAVSISNYGGIISQIITPDRKGVPDNICLGFDDFTRYFSGTYQKVNPFFGALAGRYANRIANGQFRIDSTVYHLPANDGKNTLHGGWKGFDKKTWNPVCEQNKNTAKLTLKGVSFDGDQGFPGNLSLETVYELNNNDELIISYIATSDKKTHVNLTNHTYFNLNGCKESILNHRVQINAGKIIGVNNEMIPNGELIDIEGTPFDFSDSHPIGDHIAGAGGYDHNFVLKGHTGELNWAATAYDPDSGRKLEVLTSEPGLQFYTANFLDGSLYDGERQFSKHMGFCFETQHFPDSPNQPGFPSTLLTPGDTLESTTVYKFSVLP